MNQIKPLSVWFSNFMSYGNDLTKINLNFSKPTLIIGRNLDASTEGNIDSNGAGKSVIINAISYALYGKTIGNKIKVNKLINNINEKNMLVGISFCKTNGSKTEYYSIERWRKNKALGGDGIKILRDSNINFTNPEDITYDSIARADKQLVDIIGHSFDIFSRIVLYSSSHRLFFDLPVTSTSELSRSDIMEELFDLKELSTKSEILKEKMKENKDQLNLLNKLDEQIALSRNQHFSQLSSIIKECDEWDIEKVNKIKHLENKISELSNVDFKVESNSLNQLKIFEEDVISKQNIINLKQKDIDVYKLNIQKHNEWNVDTCNKINKCLETIKTFEMIDIDSQRNILKEFSIYENNIKDINKKLNDLKNQKNILEEKIKKTTNEIKSLLNNTCPYCSQTFAESKDALKQQEHICNEMNVEYGDINNIISQNEVLLNQYNEKMSILKSNILINSISEIEMIEYKLNESKKDLNNLQNAKNPYEILEETSIDILENDILTLKKTVFDLNTKVNDIKSNLIFSSERELNITEADLVNSKEKLNELKDSQNPHLKIKHSLENTKLPELNTKEIQTLTDTLKHQEFLYKLLTSKNSFIRKKLLSKNIQFLNEKFQHYLRKIGLPHKVQFNHDMSTTISQFGKEIDYDNLSVGQRARIHIALTYAFRAILQKLHGKITFCMLDECLDNGLSNVGVQMAVKMIKEIAKEEELSIFVISHKDEIHGMFDSKLEIELENKFSSITKCDV